jgi:hypothetical protein
MSCSPCPVLPVLFLPVLFFCPILPSCSDCLLHLILPLLFYPFNSASCFILAVLSLKPCPCSPVLAVLFWKSRHGIFALSDLFCLSSRPLLSVLSWLSCPGYKALAVISWLFLSWQPCTAYPVLPVQFCLYCSACPLLLFLFCLSSSACPVLSVLICCPFISPALAVYFCQSISTCLVQPVLFCLSCSACSFLTVLFWLSLFAVLSFLSCPCCLILAVMCWKLRPGSPLLASCPGGLVLLPILICLSSCSLKIRYNCSRVPVLYVTLLAIFFVVFMLPRAHPLLPIKLFFATSASYWSVRCSNQLIFCSTFQLYTAKPFILFFKRALPRGGLIQKFSQ